jgi:hypothetical protein
MRWITGLITQLLQVAKLKGFHIQAAYWIVKTNKPKHGPDNVWEYPRLEDVLKECGMKTIQQ